MDLSGSNWKDCPYTCIGIGDNIIFYQGGTINHGTHIPEQVSKSSAGSEYNAEFTSRTDLAHFSMLIH